MLTGCIPHTSLQFVQQAAGADLTVRVTELGPLDQGHRAAGHGLKVLESQGSRLTVLGRTDGCEVHGQHLFQLRDYIRP